MSGEIQEDIETLRPDVDVGAVLTKLGPFGIENEGAKRERSRVEHERALLRWVGRGRGYNGAGDSRARTCDLELGIGFLGLWVSSDFHDRVVRLYLARVHIVVRRDAFVFVVAFWLPTRVMITDRL